MREPIADGLFTWPDPDPALIGGRCDECGRFTFPLRTGCPFCGATAVRRHLLDRRGALWSWTSQGFLPKPPFAGQAAKDPEHFQPWFVGLIEIPGQLRVEAILADCDQNDLRIGRAMRLVLVPFRVEEPDIEIMTFAFAPEPSADQEANHG